MRRILRLALVGALLFGCVGCDQVTKHVARAQLALGESHTFFGDTLRLVHVENSGAFLSIGEKLPTRARVFLFQGMIGLIVIALLWVAIFRPGLRPVQIVGFSLLASSGMGNLIDRLLFDGRVTDFLNIGIGNLRTGIFNVADVVGVLGLALLVLAKTTGESSSISLRRKA